MLSNIGAVYQQKHENERGLPTLCTYKNATTLILHPFSRTTPR